MYKNPKIKKKTKPYNISESLVKVGRVLYFI